MAGAFDYFSRPRPPEDYAWPEQKTTQDEWGNTYDATGKRIAEAQPYTYDENTPTGIFSKAFGSLTGIDTPGQRRAKTPWTEAYANTIRAFTPYTNERQSIIPDTLYGMRAPIDVTGKAVRGEPVSNREQAEAMLGIVGLGGMAKIMAGGASTPSGWIGKKIGLTDPYLDDPKYAGPLNPINAGDYVKSAFSKADDVNAPPPDISSAKLAWRYGADLNTNDILQRTVPSPDDTRYADLQRVARQAYGMDYEHLTPEKTREVKLVVDNTAPDGSPQLFANGDEKSILGAFGNNQTPFYGENVGPKGRIADPVSTAERLGLKSGVADAPMGGFFNPATSALLQEGVAPKQTVTYYAKQMGSRGGKLPPGMWEKATEGLRPDEVIARDDLVKRLDAMAPQLDKRAFFGSEDADYGESRDLMRAGASGPAQYKDYATKGPFENYRETVVGYDVPRNARYEASNAGPRAEGAFIDNHFDHPNMEGWYRTQEAEGMRSGFEDQVAALKKRYDAGEAQATGPTSSAYMRDLKALDNARYEKILQAEEVQPQRYQKMRDVGESVPQEQLRSWSSQRDRAHADIDMAKRMIRKHETDALAFELDPSNPFDIQRIINDPTDPRAPKLKAAQDAVIRLKQDIIASQDRIRDLDGKIMAANKGVQRSPYTHDVNAATDFLLKNLVNDAVKAKADRISWTPGEAQADRYNQRLNNIKGIRYEPSNGTLYVKQGGDRNWLSLKSGVPKEQLGDYVGEDVAKKLLATESKPHMPGSNYSGHMLEFPEGMSMGGEGMKGFYGSGPRGEGGILTSRIKSLWKRLTGQDATVEPYSILTGKPSPLRNGEPPKGGAHYPSVALPKEMRDTVRKTGLPLFSNGDEKGAFFLNHGGQYDMFGHDAPKSIASAFAPRDLNEGFYSVLDEAMDKIQRKQGPAQGWINDLKKAGVKDQEIYWRGLDDFLKSKGNKPVTKDEIKQHLDENKVKLWSDEHTADGESVESLRESMRERAYEDARDNASDNFEVKMDEDVIEANSRRYKIEEEAPEHDDPLGDKGEARYRVVDKEDPDNTEPLEEGLTRKRAEKFVRNKAIEDADEYGDLYALYEDGQKVDEGFATEESAMERAHDLYVEREVERIDNMSDKEILDENDARMGENTSNYIDGEAPGKLEDYRESVLGVRGDTLKRKGSPGWTSSTGMSADSIHPDSFYEHSPGWRLESDYVDALDPTKSGTAVHEVQSRWHARGAEKGWKTADKEELARLQGAFEREQAKLNELDAGAYQPLENGDLALVDVEKIKGDGYLDGGDAFQSFVRDVKNLNGKIESAKRDIPYWEERLQRELDAVATGAGDTYEINRIKNKIEYYKSDLKEAQEYLPRAVADLEEFKKKYVIETVPEGHVAGWEQPDLAEAQRYSAWKKALDAQTLRFNEAESAYKAAKTGVSPGPFVGEKSDIMAFLLKHGLYQAAKKGDDFFSVQGPERMRERWGERGPFEDYGRIDPKTGKEAGVIPMTLQKLARMHDPKASLDKIYPANKPERPVGNYAETKSLYSGEGGINPALPMEELTSGPSGAFIAQSSSRVRDVALHKDPDTGQPVYVLKLDDHRYLGDHGQEAYDVNSTYNGPVKFKSRAAAERAMEKINSDIDAKSAPLSKDQAIERYAGDDNARDAEGEPFWGIRLTPELRDSIVKRGFPMFANGDEKAAFLAAMSPQTQELAKQGGFDLGRHMFHGTTHDVSGGFRDPKLRENWAQYGEPGYDPNSFHGPAIYASSSKSDSVMNYLENGADLNNRLAMAMDMGLTEDEARAKLLGGNPSVIPLVSRAQNIVNLNSPGRMNSWRPGKPAKSPPKPPQRETAFDYDSGYNPDTDEYGNPSGSGIELLGALEQRLRDTGLSQKEQNGLIADVEGAMMDRDGLTASEFENIVRNSEKIFGILDSEYGSPGNLLQHVYRDMGYDGIAHMNADWTFSAPGLPMLPGTTHYSFFDPEKLRAVGAAFDPNRRHESGLYYSSGVPGVSLSGGAFEDENKR